MQRHVSKIHHGAEGHHPHDLDMMHGEYKSHPGRWFLDHPMLPALLVTGIIAILIASLLAVVYLGITTGEWALFRV